MIKATVVHLNKKFLIMCDYYDARAKQALQRTWDPKREVWELPLIEKNAVYIHEKYTKDEIAPSTYKIITDIVTARIRRESAPFPRDFTFKNTPMEHQTDVLHRMWGKTAYALFMEMGTGKSYVAINWVSALFSVSKSIKSVLVVCPASVKPVWLNEFKLHCPIESDIFILEAGGSEKYKKWILSPRMGKMRVLVVGVEALSQGKGFSIAKDFAIHSNSAMIIDESSRIKTPTSARTKKCWDLADFCGYRLILSGTPITQGMQDLFAQYRFLDWTIIGQKSYFSFQNKYCVMGGFEGRKIIGYDNVDELMLAVSNNTYIVKKDEVLDLPPKVYESIVVQPTTHQAEVFKGLEDEVIMSATVGDHTLDVETILERMTRYQQIAGGLFPYDNNDGSHGVTRLPGVNPKLNALMETLDVIGDDRKIIIWARFKEEQRWIVESLENKYGPHSVIHYAAGTTTGDRIAMIEAFQDKCNGYRFFVSNPTMGGIGLTLIAATFVIYYSNSFSLEDRLQSEDRAHRKGQTESVTYIDITMNHKIDRDIHEALKRKQSVASYVEDRIKNG